MIIRKWLDKRKKHNELARQYAHISAKKFSEAPWVSPEERQKVYSRNYRDWYQMGLTMSDGMLRFSINLDRESDQLKEESIEEIKRKEEDSRHIPSRVRREVWIRDGGRCVRCGSRKNLEYDHIIPVSKGGSNTARNIELLCESCNRAKRNNIE